MTDAEKALKIFKDANEGCGCEGCLLVINSLQRASETWLDKTAAMADAAMVCKLTDENKALKVKAQGLLKALELARMDVKVGRGADWIIKDMDNALAAFNHHDVKP